MKAMGEYVITMTINESKGHIFRPEKNRRID